MAVAFDMRQVLDEYSMGHDCLSHIDEKYPVPAHIISHRPPSTGPMTEAMPNVAPIAPATCALFGGNRSRLSHGVSHYCAAPMPWRARKMTSCTMSDENPESMEPVMNMTIPMMNNFFLPYMSDSFP